MAGVLGVNPDPFTARELTWMVRGRQMEQWNHTAMLAALIYNAFRSSSSKALSPADFHPLLIEEKQEQEELPKITVAQLANILTKMEKRKQWSPSKE